MLRLQTLKALKKKRQLPRTVMIKVLRMKFKADSMQLMVKKMHLMVK